MPSETAKASLGYVTSYGAARRGGYTGTYEEWCALMAEVADHLEENIQLNEDSQAAKAAAETAELEAEAAALTAESWAKGTKGGTDVPSTDPAYHDNAKYYAGEAEGQKDLAEQAASAAAGSAETAGGHSTDAEAWAAGTRGGEDVESGDDAYHNNAKYYSEQSSGFADDAAGSASDAESWAKGTKNGTDVPSTDPTYHNNAKYWSEQAEETAEGIEASSAQIAQNASDIGDLKTQLSDVIIYPNLVNPDEITPSRYMPPNSTSKGNSTYDYTGLIPVSPGETLYVSPRGRYLQARNQNNQRVDAAGVDSNFTEYTVPEGIVGVYITFYHDQSDTFMVSKYSGIPYTPYNTPYFIRSLLPELSQIVENENEITKLKTIKKHYYTLKDDSMGANDALVIEKNLPIKNGTLIRFSGTVGANFNGIEIGFTNDISQSDLTHFKIDATKVYRATTNPFETEHDLTISGNLVISLEQTYTHLKLYVECNGSKYETSSGWSPSNAYPYIKVLSTFSDCSFSLTAKKNKAHITVFGDSYVSYGVERWPYYLAENNFDDNSSILGYSGERSDAAYKNFTDFMPINSPKFVVWALGMNDTDTGGAINSTWKTAIDAVIEYCNANNITPVLCTIPNVPNRDNSLKNTYVRSFDGTYPIIDFAKAVGSDISSAWFSGMLSDDNVHPTALGAIALYNRAITDFPELCVSN